MTDELAHILRTTLPSILIPPVGLFWVMLAGMMLTKRHRRTGVATIGGALGLLYALSTPAVGGALIASLERDIPNIDGPNIDGPNIDGPTIDRSPGAIVVLGGDGDRTPDGAKGATPGALSLQRLAGAAVLERKSGLPVLITGGPVGLDEPSVADLMADQFRDAFGLPVAWRETLARNTCENARFSAAILRHAGIDRAYVVTHAWHMRRAMLSFADVGYPVVPAPLPRDTGRVHGFEDFLPHTQAWIRSFYALHEWVGLIGYRLGGCDRSIPVQGVPDPPVPNSAAP